MTAEGALDVDDTGPALDRLRAAWTVESDRLGPFHGTAVWRLTVAADGSVTGVEAVVDNLVAGSPGASDPAALLSAGSALLGEAVFPSRDGPTSLVVPLG